MTGDFGPSCDRGGDGSSGSSSRPPRPAQLPSPLAFASKPERGARGGIVGGGGGGGGCSFGVVMGATRKSVYHQKRFHGSIFFDPLPRSILLGMATSSSVTLRNCRTRRTLHGSFFLLFNL